MPTPQELKLIHLAYRQAGLEEEHYRLILRNVAGADSAKKLDQVDFENVMAVLEDSGFCHAGKPSDYWRSIVSMRGSYCGPRIVAKIETLAADQKYDLVGLCKRVSNDRTGRIDKLFPREGSAMIEMLKAIGRREAAKQTAVLPPADAAGAPSVARSEARTASGSSTVPDAVAGLGGVL